MDGNAAMKEMFGAGVDDFFNKDMFSQMKFLSILSKHGHNPFANSEGNMDGLNEIVKSGDIGGALNHPKHGPLVQDLVQYFSSEMKEPNEKPVDLANTAKFNETLDRWQGNFDHVGQETDAFNAEHDADVEAIEDEEANAAAEMKSLNAADGETGSFESFLEIPPDANLPRTRGGQKFSSGLSAFLDVGPVLKGKRSEQSEALARRRSKLSTTTTRTTKCGLIGTTSRFS